MSSQAENGRRAIIKGLAPVEHGVSLVKVIPVWGAGAVINVVLVFVGYFVLSSLAEVGAAPPDQPEMKPSTEVEAPEKDKVLDNTDIGEDETQETNYLVDKLDEVSVPGKVDPAAPSGLK